MPHLYCSLVNYQKLATNSSGEFTLRVRTTVTACANAADPISGKRIDRTALQGTSCNFYVQFSARADPDLLLRKSLLGLYLASKWPDPQMRACLRSLEDSQILWDLWVAMLHITTNAQTTYRHSLQTGRHGLLELHQEVIRTK